MSKKSDRRDRMQRLTPLAALALSIVSLWLTFYWHRQEVEDRLIVRIGAVRNQYKDHSEAAFGNLNAQVVNIGSRPVYIRQVELMVGGGGAFFFGGNDLAGATAALKRLAPGEEADFKIRWDFSVNPILLDERSNFFRLVNEKGKGLSATVYVETTRTSFNQPANIYEVTHLLTNTLPPKPVVHPPSWRPPAPVMKSATVRTAH